jgi:hypothetical protein
MKRYFTFIIIALTMIMTACSGDNSESRLRETIVESNKECPASIDHVTVLKEIKIEGEFVTYVCEIDETLLDMETMQSQRAIYNQNIQNMIRNQLTNTQATNAPFLQLVMDAGKGVRHHYVGNRSGKTLIIDVTNSQMQQLASPLKNKEKTSKKGRKTALIVK